MCTPLKTGHPPEAGIRICIPFLKQASVSVRLDGLSIMTKAQPAIAWRTIISRCPGPRTIGVRRDLLLWSFPFLTVIPQRHICHIGVATDLIQILCPDSPPDPLIILVQSGRVDPNSAGIDFRRQNLTSVDVRF